MFTDEDVTQFVHRRGRLAAAVQRRIGNWSTKWAQAVINWHAHLRRSRNESTWAAKLFYTLPANELAERRAFYGRPGTRIRPGWIKLRWSESVQTAQDWLARDTS